ncbi:MAG: hypothetical protein E5Y67_12265 [Mesorhizobium sp.]|uniref:hypothetical protein n=1 Tax=Mesorhizobium sp. TaxID=1871066 RepID=UPI0012196E8B|nr:hypothetical protein [Mesorhizobium sp.]TIM14447.1 MAG: hypothetical protein E5Y67_12265 [Mesorhizobium sp.]
MVNPDGVSSTSPDIILRVRQHIPEFTRLDGSRNVRGLATTFGVARSTIERYLAKIDVEDAQAAQINYTPDIDGIEEIKPRVRVRAYNVSVTKDLPVRRMVAIGDLHLKPGMDFEHMRWIGRYVAETRPDNVLQIGDCFDFESCEMHSAAGSASQMKRPAFIDEIEAGQDAFDIYHSEIGAGEIPHDVIYGNHEYRVNRLEELAPNLAGTLTLQVDQFFARYRWRTTPYRHWLFFEGVGFTHVPMSIMQKPIGGRYPENTIGNQATHSIVFGHTHRNNNVTVPKIGINNSITITNLGSAMPHGYTPKYTDGATTGYTYGVHELRLRGGRVESDKFISMLELEERYK